MKALITGITGFVGGHLAKHLADAGDEVLGVSQNGDWPADFSLPVPLVPADLASDFRPHFIEEIDKYAPDVIYHLAALSIPSDCGTIDEPSEAAKNVNVGGVTRVLDLATCLRSRPRVVFTSSSHVYGAVDPASPVVDENAPCRPRTAYGLTKLSAEQVCLAAVKERFADVVIVRSFAQAGERQDPRLMLAEWSAAFARRDAEITIGNDNVTIDLVDVGDAVRALRLLALHGASGTVYNIGTGVSRTTGELLQLLQRMADDLRPVRVRSSERRSDPVANIERLQAATGWRPEVPIERTIADVWHYWRSRLRAEAKLSEAN